MGNGEWGIGRAGHRALRSLRFPIPDSPSLTVHSSAISASSRARSVSMASKVAAGSGRENR